MPYRTSYEAVKRTSVTVSRFGALDGYWAALNGVEYQGYEIRHGHTEPQPGEDAHRLVPVLADGAGWQYGQTLALYTHGLFENAAVLRALFGHSVPTLDDTLDGLGDFVEEHIGYAVLNSLLTRL